MILNMMVVVPTLIMASVTLVFSLCLINTGIHDSDHDGGCLHPHHGLRLCLINTGIHDSEHDGCCPHPHHGLHHPWPLFN
jgi:hypothetical protein